MLRMTATSDTPTTDDALLDQVEPKAPETEEGEVTADAEKSDTELWLEAEKDYLQWKRNQTVEPDWAYTVIEYEGDTLGIRIPTQAALTAFTLGTGEFTPDLTRQSMTSMFVQNHLSPRSYGHVFRRMMTPDDTFDDASLGGLMRRMVEEASKVILEEQKAQAESKAVGKTSKSG